MPGAAIDERLNDACAMTRNDIDMIQARSGITKRRWPLDVGQKRGKVKRKRRDCDPKAVPGVKYMAAGRWQKWPVIARPKACVGINGVARNAPESGKCGDRRTPGWRPESLEAVWRVSGKTGKLPNLPCCGAACLPVLWAARRRRADARCRRSPVSPGPADAVPPRRNAGQRMPGLAANDRPE